MDLDPEQLTAAALRLAPSERARVAEALLASLDAEDGAWEAEWLAEAVRRDRDAEGNPARVRPAAAVFAEARASLQGETGPVGWHRTAHLMWRIAPWRCLISRR